MSTSKNKDLSNNDPSMEAEEMESDEEDEDYVPGADGDDSGNDDDNDAGATHDDTAAATLSITKQQAVDDAFDDLFGIGASAKYEATMGSKSPSKIPSKKNNRAIKKQKNILSSIFGSRSTSKLFSNSKNVALQGKPKPPSNGILRLEKRTVVEVKRFAGQEIKVEKVVTIPVMEPKKGTEQNIGSATSESASPTSASAASATLNDETQQQTSQRTNQPKVQPQGLDSLLHQISRPEKLSTVAKTSADWDLFKEKSDNSLLKEELEKKALGNEAYLVKKDFLNRVDVRRFELEKAERERERVKRAASNGK